MLPLIFSKDDVVFISCSMPYLILITLKSKLNQFVLTKKLKKIH